MSISSLFKNTELRTRIIARFIGIKKFSLAWCDPCAISFSTRYFVYKRGGFLFSGAEIPKRKIRIESPRFIDDGDWDKEIVPISDVKAISRTQKHFSEGLSWSEVGEIKWMMENISEYGKQDGCTNLAEVEERCARLDSMKEQIERVGHFEAQKNINPSAFREKGGIGIIISRAGDLIWFTDGAHRLGIARHLKIKSIPICIHKVHSSAILSGAWKNNLSFTRQIDKS